MTKLGWLPVSGLTRRLPNAVAQSLSEAQASLRGHPVILLSIQHPCRLTWTGEECRHGSGRRSETFGPSLYRFHAGVLRSSVTFRRPDSQIGVIYSAEQYLAGYLAGHDFPRLCEKLRRLSSQSVALN